MPETMSPSEVPDAPSTAENEPVEKAARPPAMHRFFWQGKIAPAFWTISSIISMIVNIVLIVILISLGKQLFTLKDLVKNQVLGGLYQNFVMMDQAHMASLFLTTLSPITLLSP